MAASAAQQHVRADAERSERVRVLDGFGQYNLHLPLLALHDSDVLIPCLLSRLSCR